MEALESVKRFILELSQYASSTFPTKIPSETITAIPGAIPCALPLSIIIAGLFIAGGVYWNGKITKEKIRQYKTTVGTIFLIPHRLDM